jgi:hypothetical protein
MIVANVRAGLTERDLELLLDVLSDGDADCREGLRGRLARDGRDALLDAPGLFERLLASQGVAGPTAPLFIYVAVRTVLRTVGVDDIEISDYLSALLLEFGRRDRAWRIAPADDQVYRYVSDIVADVALVADERRAFLLRAHLGNFSLWLSGVFPDRIVARRLRRGGPDLSYYEEMGARGFRLASDHHLARACHLEGVFDRAAACFERLRIGLNRLSDTLFFRTGPNPERLMRQVVDAYRRRLADN